MQTIVVLLNSAQSHYNASYKLIKNLKSRGFNAIYIGYAFQNNRETTLAQGFDFVDVQTLIDELKRDSPDTPVNKRITLPRIFDPSRMEKIFDCLLIFKAICDRYDPALFIVDADLSPYIFPLHFLKKKAVIFNSMISWNEGRLNPPMFSGFISNDLFFHRCFVKVLWLKYYISRWISSSYYLQFFGHSLSATRRNIIRCARLFHYPVDQINFNRFYFGFHSILEIHSTSREFEFPFLKSHMEIFIGPSVLENRQAPILESDQRLTKQLLALRLKYRYIVYCTFGTLGQYEKKKINVLFRKLVDAFRDNDECFIIVSFGYAFPKENFDIPENMQVFEFVRQIEILDHSDVMIGSGGMNAINECIVKKVPMLIYPFSLDQFGNSARVCLHGIGLRGNVFRDSAKDLRNKVKLLLKDGEFRGNIDRFSAKAMSHPSFDNLDFMSDIA